MGKGEWWRQSNLALDFKTRLATTMTSTRARQLVPKDKTKPWPPRAQRPLSVATVNHHLKLLKAIYNRAIPAGRLTHNPVAAVRRSQEHNARNRCLSPVEEGGSWRPWRRAYGPSSAWHSIRGCGGASYKPSGGMTST
jgi:hypothetical protein